MTVASQLTRTPSAARSASTQSKIASPDPDPDPDPDFDLDPDEGDLQVGNGSRPEQGLHEFSQAVTLSISHRSLRAMSPSPAPPPAASVFAAERDSPQTPPKFNDSSCSHRM
jgi:hypothetical protein